MLALSITQLSYQTRMKQETKHTNQRQPNKLKAEDRHESQGHPEQRLRVQGNPEEPAVSRVYDLHGRVGRLEYPVRVPRLRVDFVPPP